MWWVLLLSVLLPVTALLGVAALSTLGLEADCLCSAWIQFRISFSSSNLCRLRLEWATLEFARPAWSWQDLNSKQI